MKKVWSLLLVMMLAMTAFMVGCSTDNGNESGDPGDQTGDALKVGFLYLGTENDGGFTQAQNNGRLALEDHFGDKVETLFVEQVAENTQDVKTAALNLIDQGCTVIIGGSYGFMDGMEKLAGEYPEVYFLHFSGSKSNDTNFDNFFGAMEEPRYLAGMVAGLMTETNQLGYVAAFPYAEVNIGINAFALGAQSVNPDVEVKVVYINSWYDPASEKAAAEALLAQGCDVIEQHCDTTGPILAAEAADAYAIGYNLDIRDVAPETFLTAPIWDYEKYYTYAVESIMNGTFKPESYYGHMSDGLVDLAPIADFVPQDVKDQVESVKKQIVDGEFEPFSGYIEYMDGSVLCEEGQTLTREEIWSITGVIKGVTATE